MTNHNFSISKSELMSVHIISAIYTSALIETMSSGLVNLHLIILIPSQAFTRTYRVVILV